MSKNKDLQFRKYLTTDVDTGLSLETAATETRMLTADFQKLCIQSFNCTLSGYYFHGSYGIVFLCIAGIKVQNVQKK